MNSIVSFLKLLGSSLAHIVGDPVHEVAATALQTTLAASAQAIEAGAEDAFNRLSGKLSEVLSVSGSPGNVTPAAWRDLHQTAQDVHAEAVSFQSQPPVERSAPTPPTGSTQSAPPPGATPSSAS